jgi:hypothetical protein
MDKTKTGVLQKLQNRGMRIILIVYFFKNEALREIGTKIDKSDYSILHHVTSLIYIEL